MKERLKKRIASPYTFEDFHFFATFFWLLMILPTILFWRESVLWVSFMSLYAIIVSHATGISAAKGEQKIEEVADKIER